MLTESGVTSAADTKTEAGPHDPASVNPRAVITGVTPHKTDTRPATTLGAFERSAGGRSEFDWYAATFPELPVDDLLAGLSEALGLAVEAGTALHGYTEGYNLVGPSGVAVRVLGGGSNGGPNAWASGADAAGYAEVVRALWPTSHRVSRFDSRIDLGGTGDGDDVWDQLFAACVKRATESGLKTSLAGDYLGKEKGRTLYVGSQKSAVFVRLYEKGKQLQGLTRDPDARAAIPRDWCRLEVQVRPQKDARWKAAAMTPDEAWGLSAWSKTLAKELAGLDVDQVSMQHKRETNDERALAWLATQYAGTLQRLAMEQGVQQVTDRLWALVFRGMEDS